MSSQQELTEEELPPPKPFTLESSELPNIISEEKLEQEPSIIESYQPEPLHTEMPQQEASEHESIQQEPSEQSEFSIDSAQSTATSTLAETESTYDHHSESEQSLSGISTGTNSMREIDEHLSLGDYEKAAAQMIDVSLKRKDSPEMDAVCSAAKKCKPSQEVENDTIIPFPPVECK